MKTVILFTALCTLLFFSACSKEETQTEVTPPQPEKVERAAVEPVEEKTEMVPSEAIEPQEMKVTTEEGTLTLKKGEGAVPADLGVPVYPGAEKKEDLSLNMESGETLQGVMSTQFHSGDTIDDVLAFYKDKLQAKNPTISEMNMGNARMVNIILENEPPTIHIALTEDKETGGTNIQIAKVQE